MNDPSTLAATEHGDRDGLPAAPDPTDGPLRPTPPAAPAPPDREPHPEPLRTLLETAATCRPVEEVTALVSLLKETGGLAGTGHDALRAAAVTRPVDDVRHMVALLGEHPHEEAEADITLRAAAVGRPIEDVALLASILGPDGAPRTDRPPARTALPPPQDAPAATPEEAGPEHAAPEGLAPVGVAPFAPWPAAAPAPVAAAAAAPVVAAPLPAPAAPARARAHPGGALRHVLRWPTAAALLLCGVLHLPGDLAQPPAPDGLAPLAVSLLCLALGALLAVRDTPAVWRSAAVAALAVVTLHIVGGVVLFDPLDGTLGGPYAWSGVTVVLCAGAGAVLAGLALKYRLPSAPTGGGA
ncbi:hypothetical protein [Streptomyces sp. NBC_00091]|uniref:hypothetical protein n=1 Tax=Streptomyces sp. NBC_00091 TaxID=2975648 RepID=UPI00224F62B8|nr:hypothetical protein [Streptomyces sp. NBC_00091]MCX5380641.1 hypothetical protein [Streptomyces sp. NBC_00091]